MKSIFAIVFVSIYGIVMRLLFAFLDNIMGIMSITFLILLPVIIGFLTVRLIPNEKTRTATAAFFKPWLTSFVILAITIVLSIEGIICWLMLFPLFLLLAGCGGIIAFNTRKGRIKNTDSLDSNDWDKPNTLNISLVLLVPLLLGIIEGEKTLIMKNCTVVKEVVIPAARTDVWYTLTHINEVHPNEKPTAAANFLGFPQHVRTTLPTLSVGAKRLAVYEKGLYFEESIANYVPDSLLVLDIKTDPLKIPPTVLDEHIVIGGKHLDILQDIYTLQTLPDGNCRLRLSSRYYINTPFNWYAGIWARYLMADLLQGELEMIKARTVKQLQDSLIKR